MTTDKDARLAQWWADWWAADYSWEGLGKRGANGRPHKPWLGWFVPPEGETGEAMPTEEAPEGWRRATLQDYWRHTGLDPENDLIKDVPCPDGENRAFTIFHLPLVDGEGNETPKGRDDWADRASFDQEIAQRLRLARETEGELESHPRTGAEIRAFIPNEADQRVQFHGIVFKDQIQWSMNRISELQPTTHQDGPPSTDAPLLRVHIAARQCFFNRSLFLTDQHFGSGTDFSGTLFSRDASFVRAKFTGDVNFKNVLFCGQSIFYEAIFSGIAFFTKAMFSEFTSFYSATFSGEAYFPKAILSGGAHFHHAIFARYASFQMATFSRYTDFSSAIFIRGTLFGNAIFLQDTFFSNAAFSGNANFESVSFCGALNFADSYFSNFANFTGFSAVLERQDQKQAIRLKAARDSDGLSGDMTIAGGATPEAKRAFLEAVFSGAWFDGAALFSNRNMLGRFDLTDATFMGRAEFHGSAFHQDFRLTGATFFHALGSTSLLRSIWSAVLDFIYVPAPPPPPPTPPEEMLKRLHDAARKTAEIEGTSLPSYPAWRQEFLRARTENRQRAIAGRTGADYAAIENAFQTLKLGMETLRRRNEEQRFFRLELLARRRRRDDQVKASERFFSFCYQIFADFGGSFWLPVGWLFGLLMAFAGAFYAMTPRNIGLCPVPGASAASAPSPGFAEALIFSGQNMFWPFSIWRARDISACGGGNAVAARLLDHQDPWFGLLVRGLGTLESLLAVALIFLAALALRRRFQMN